MFRFSSLASDGATQSAKFRTAFFGQFRTSLRKHSVANYASISTLFSLFFRAAYARDNILPVCIVLRGTMLLFLVCLFVGHAPSPERRAFEGCIVRTRIALSFIGRFGRGLHRFFRK